MLNKVWRCLIGKTIYIKKENRRLLMQSYWLDWEKTIEL